MTVSPCGRSASQLRHADLRQSCVWWRATITNVRLWLLGACVIAGLGCPTTSDAPEGYARADAGSDGDAGPSNSPGGNSSDQCARGQIPCGTGCIPSGAVCCSPVSTSYCTNAAGGGCNSSGTCSGAFPGGATAEFCCATDSNLGSNDCPSGQHHCGLSCRPTSQGCCSRSTDLCSPAATGGGMDAGTDAAADGSVIPDAGDPDAAMSEPDAGPGSPPDDRCCACNFDVYCTEFGSGGCWYCNHARYDANNVCPAPEGYLTSPGACTCDPTLYQVCL